MVYTSCEWFNDRDKHWRRKHELCSLLDRSRNSQATIESGQAIVLDVTSPFIEGAVRGKIPGAVRVSPRAILDRNRHPADLVTDLPDLSYDKTIIAYCTCADEEASTRLTRVLRSQGYDAWLLEGGLPAWRAAGYPMELKHAVAA